MLQRGSPAFRVRCEGRVVLRVALIKPGAPLLAFFARGGRINGHIFGPAVVRGQRIDADVAATLLQLQCLDGTNA
jgi:hypothetical protein